MRTQCGCDSEQGRGRLPRIRNSTDASWKPPFGSKYRVACTTGLRPTAAGCSVSPITGGKTMGVIETPGSPAPRPDRHDISKPGMIKTYRQRPLSWEIDRGKARDWPNKGRCCVAALASNDRPGRPAVRAAVRPRRRGAPRPEFSCRCWPDHRLSSEPPVFVVLNLLEFRD